MTHLGNAHTPPRFPPLRLFGRLPPSPSSRPSVAGVRNPLTSAVALATAPLNKPDYHVERPTGGEGEKLPFKGSDTGRYHSQDGRPIGAGGRPLRSPLPSPVARAWRSASSWAWWAIAAAAALRWVYLPAAPASDAGGRQIRTGRPKRDLRRRRRATVVAVMAWAWRLPRVTPHYSAAPRRGLVN
jgi:hypothetical protein